MATCFVVANELEIAQMQDMGDVIHSVEKSNLSAFGDSLEEVICLSEIVLENERKPAFVREASEDKTRFYLFDSELCEKIAALEHEQLLDLSIPFSEIVCWRNRKHNRMDLAGFLLSLAIACKLALEQRSSLYIAVEN